MEKTFGKLMLALLVLVSISGSIFAKELPATIADINANPAAYDGKEVSVSGFFSIWKNAPGAPPITRSDWVLCDANKKGIYCNGAMPSDEETGEIESYWKPLKVVAIVSIKDKVPFLRVISTKAATLELERTLSVQQIILNQEEMMGKHVGIVGVLSKGYGIKGDRMYLIADPTGAIRIGRTSKLYPKGTIMHIKGIATTDQYGIPMIDQVEVISAKVD